MYKIYSKINNVFTEVSITNEIKEKFKYGITKGYLEVVSTGQIIDHSNYLQSFDFDDCRFVDGEGIIGSCVAKGLEGKFINPDNTLDSIENEDVKAYIGTTVNNVDYYIKLGTFIIQKPENDNATDGTSFEGLDYMIKFNKIYEHQLNGTYTLLQLLQNICTQCGVTCGTNSFRNSTYSLTGNPFDDGVSCRDVLKAIAQIAFSWARINENDELVLDFNLSDTITETMSNDDYYDLTFNNAYGPINTIVLKNSQVEGENYTLIDPNKGESDPTRELSISDNPFAYNQALRQQLIQAGSAMFGFTYVPVTFTDIGFIWLNCLDKVRIRNMQYDPNTAPNEYYDTYLFDIKIHYNGAVSGEKETNAMTETETQYKFTGTLFDSQKRTEIIVDKANGKIDAVASQANQISSDLSGINTDLQNQINTTNTDLSEYKQVVTSQFEQIPGQMTMTFEEKIVPYSNKIDDNTESLAEVKTNISFDSNGIHLGKSNNPFTVLITNQEIDFNENGQKIAYINGNKFYITQGEILDSLKLGNFAFTPRANGSLSFGKVGG